MASATEKLNSKFLKVNVKLSLNDMWVTDNTLENVGLALMS